MRWAARVGRQQHRGGHPHLARGGRVDPRVEEDRAVIGGAIHRHEHRILPLEPLEIMVGRGDQIGEGHRHGRGIA
jgi:hypothetical protein